MIKCQKKQCEPSTRHLPEMISFENVSLCFRKHTSLFNLLFTNPEKKKKQLFWALKDLSFKLYEGDTMGVVGRNGSGKSSFSMVCSKIYPPDKGNIIVNGKAQILALGVGFQKLLSGRENVYISGSLLGLKYSEIREKMGEIEDFADIGDFMDEPVRTYSSGMKSRLAFSIATAIRPDILILDEVLATGDDSFREKAMARIKNLHALAKCAIIVSHNPNQLKELCNKFLWLEKGRIIMQGDSNAVLDAYQAFCKNPQKWELENPEYFSRSF